MELFSKENYEIIDFFEKRARKWNWAPCRFEKETKSLWSLGHIYCHGETNALFLSFREGYAFGKAAQRDN